MFPDEMAQPGSLSSRDEKKFDSVFVSLGPNHPNLRDKDRMGCLGDCQYRDLRSFPLATSVRC